MEEKFLIIANWKSNSPLNWSVSVPENIEVAIAPPFPLLATIKGYSLCAQDVSQFGPGAYTGEVSAKVLAGLGVKYCLVGHSERRKNFGETNAQIQQKISQLLENKIMPIICAQNLEELPKNIEGCSIMYEPAEAISVNGQYNPESPEKIKTALSFFPKDVKLLYGGSVNSDDILAIKPLVTGVVVGHASLDPQMFTQIATKCS